MELSYSAEWQWTSGKRVNSKTIRYCVYCLKCTAYQEYQCLAIKIEGTDLERFVKIIVSRKAQVLGVILSLMFVVYSIINLSQLNSETDANFVIKRGILITSSIIFGLSACAGIVTLLISKRQKKS